MAHKNSSNYSPLRSRPNGKSHKKPTIIFSEDEANNRLFDIFRNHNFDHISHSQRILLAKYYVLLMEQQKKENFTRLTNLKDIAIKHFIDCLVLPRIYNLKFPLADLGSGPGFPGVPLKIIFPKEKIYLIEGVQKRVNFLKNVRDKLKLSNTEIIGKNISNSFQYPINNYITRAVEDINNTLDNVYNSLTPGGHIYFMKGPNYKKEVNNISSENLKRYSLHAQKEYVLPETSNKRSLIVLKKEPSS